MASFAAGVEWDEETQLYIGRIPAVHAAHTQAATLEELWQNLEEVLALCLEEDEDSNPPFPSEHSFC